MLEQVFGKQDVARVSNLDIAGLAIDQHHLMTGHLIDRRVVGIDWLVGPLIGSLEGNSIEDLWRLNSTQLRAWNDVARAVRSKLPNRVGHLDHRHCRATFAGHVKCALNQCRAQQWPHAVLHSDDVALLHVQRVDGVLHALPSCIATGDHTMRHQASVLAAQLLPQLLVSQRQHHDSLMAKGGKSLQCAHEHRPPRQQHKLLGHGGTKTRASPAGNDDSDIVHGVVFTVK